MSESIPDLNYCSMYSKNMIFNWSLLLSILCGALAVNDNYFKNCDFIVQLSENEGTSVINRGGFLSILGFFGYMGFFKPGSSCRYVVKVPDNYIVKIYCDIDIAITGSYNTCATEQFRVLADGTNAIMARGAFYCGKGVFAYASTNNIIAFGHTSKSYAGRYNCTVFSIYNVNH